ncbi:MAG TPA: hypothetical protein VMR29_09955, partial [Candidatus Binatia bacterium]|nr:hypothetical protein [Candidatus Binatia bacterium]
MSTLRDEAIQRATKTYGNFVGVVLTVQQPDLELPPTWHALPFHNARALDTWFRNVSLDLRYAYVAAFDKTSRAWSGGAPSAEITLADPVPTEWIGIAPHPPRELYELVGALHVLRDQLRTLTGGSRTGNLVIDDRDEPGGSAITSAMFDAANNALFNARVPTLHLRDLSDEAQEMSYAWVTKETVEYVPTILHRVELAIERLGARLHGHRVSGEWPSWLPGKPHLFLRAPRPHPSDPRPLVGQQHASRRWPGQGTGPWTGGRATQGPQPIFFVRGVEPLSRLNLDKPARLLMGGVEPLPDLPARGRLLMGSSPEAELARLLGALADAIRLTDQQITAADTGEQIEFTREWGHFVALWSKRIRSSSGIGMPELEGFARRYAALRAAAVAAGFALSTPMTVIGAYYTTEGTMYYGRGYYGRRHRHHHYLYGYPYGYGYGYAPQYAPPQFGMPQDQFRA